MKKIFISHAYKDKEIIQEFIKSLNILENQVFFSSNSHSNLIPLGENMFETIKLKIESSDIVIAIISEDFYNSIACQIEMGISYAFDKTIIPLIVIQNPNYSNILRGVFSTHNRASCIYNKKDIAAIFSKTSSNVLLINNCIDNIMEKLSDNYAVIPIEKENHNINLIENMIDQNKFNTNEVIFIKYIVENRKFELETGWQIDDGVMKFEEWLKDNNYYLNGDIKEIYNNTLKYFESIKIIEEAERTCYGNVKLYRIKQEYSNDMMEYHKNYNEYLNEICNLQYIPF